MALQALRNPVYFPTRPQMVAGGSSSLATLATLDGADEQVGMVCYAPKTGSIRKVWFHTGTVTTGASALELRIETVNATDAFPSGTLWATNTNCTFNLADTDDNAWIASAALTADASVTVGDIIAVVFKNPTSSFGNFIVQSSTLGNTTAGCMFPYAVTNTGTWATVNAIPNFLIEYSDGSTYEIDNVWPAKAFTATSYNTGTATNDEIGNRIYVPFKARASGIWLWWRAASNAADFDLVLYEGTTAQRTVSHDANRVRATSYGPLFLPFTSGFIIQPNTEYFAILKPTTTTSVTIVETELESNAQLDALNGGKEIYKVYRADGAGSWTTDNAKRCFIGVVLDQLDDGVSSGGGIFIPRRRVA